MPQKPQKRFDPGQILYRSATVTRAAIDEQTRTLELAFSSEEPVERWYGVEILDHARDSVRMDRLNDGAPLLINHDTSAHVGVVEKASIDPDHRGRATVRLGRNARAEDAWRDILDGILRHVSVGYRVHSMVLESRDDQGETYRIDDWEPIEISMVPTPADPSVGVGRQFPKQEEDPMPDTKATPKDERAEVQAPTMPKPAERAPEPPSTPKPETPAATKPEAATARAETDAEIRRIGAHFHLEREAEDQIHLGATVEEFRTLVRSVATERLKPVPTFSRVQSVPMTGRGRKLRAYSNDRQGEEAAYCDGMWMKAQLFGDRSARQWVEQNYTRVMQTGIQSKGGALLPESMLRAVIDLREEYGVARQLCRVVPMTSDTLTLPRRTGSTTAYFVGETDSITASDAAFDTVQLTARKLAALSLVSSDLIEDAVIDLADWLATDIAMQFASKEDACFIDGDGTSTYGGIYGLRTKLIDGTHTAGAIDAASGHDVLTEFDVDDLSAVVGKLPLYAKRNAKWLCSPLANALIFDALKVAGGGNTATDLSGRPMQSWWGDPIVISPAMPGATATTDYSNVVVMLYGDFMGGCLLGDRREVRVRVDESRYLEYDQVAVQATERFDIVVHGLGDTSNPGPVVGLIGE